MDPREIENWGKIKAALEAAGKTDSFYYRRAVSILAGKDDPIEKKLGDIPSGDS